MPEKTLGAHLVGCFGIEVEGGTHIVVRDERLREVTRYGRFDEIEQERAWTCEDKSYGVCVPAGTEVRRMRRVTSSEETGKLQANGVGASPSRLTLMIP